MEALKVVSADSNMTEPGALWAERLGKKYRDRAPENFAGVPAEITNRIVFENANRLYDRT